MQHEKYAAAQCEEIGIMLPSQPLGPHQKQYYQEIRSETSLIQKDYEGTGDEDEIITLSVSIVLENRVRLNAPPLSPGKRSLRHSSDH